jgi:serine protease SohB
VSLAQVPNFHRLLKKYDVDVELLTAGEYKTTLTMLGEITDKGKQKFIQELEETHVLFKEFVKGHRPQIDIDKIATGEHWYGRRAIDLDLVDEVMTSDEYLTEAAKDADLYAVSYEMKKPWNEKLAFSMQGALDRSVEKWVFGRERELFK